ncbi:hypothetical protein ACFOWX_08360 [Sphingorhabdus arenilitoris]|uniref:DUF429 domain-containing protein n=1 Tax=Sphingorhabdus arenilitoris TaxID=1490041 RepID=A0ABV8RG75_9SPHN
MRRFSNFACVDWSGAAAERPPGIAVAHIGPDGPPALLSPQPRWSRADVGEWLLQLAGDDADILVGLDLSFGFPFADEGCFFPEWDDSPADAKSLWAFIDRICAADPHLTAGSFLSHPEGQRHFRHSKDHVGDLFIGGTGRLRLVEAHQRATRQANSWSCFNLVGAGQVGKSSLTGMRMLHQIGRYIPIWPFDPVPKRGPMLAEIYTTMAARAAGMPAGRSKIRDRATLLSALAALDSPAPVALSRYDDHSTDAMITAAWLRKNAGNEAFWHPEKLNMHIAATEGWTFGVI